MITQMELFEYIDIKDKIKELEREMDSEYGRCYSGITEDLNEQKALLESWKKKHIKEEKV